MYVKRIILFFINKVAIWKRLNERVGFYLFRTARVSDINCWGISVCNLTYHFVEDNVTTHQ